MSEKNFFALNDDELNEVAGGMGGIGQITAGEAEAEVSCSRIPFACRNPKCSSIFYIKAGASRVQCPDRKKIYEIKG